MLREKTAFVTGGSGAVGAAIVRVFCREGCRVAFSYLRHSDTACELEKQTGAKGYPLDVTDSAACAQTAARVEAEIGPVDVLINNAGIAQVLPFALLEEEDWDSTMDINVKGMFLVTKAFARGMIRRKTGAIVNMSSLAGLRLLEVPVHYATAKSAVIGFTLSLAKELSRYGVRVNAVVPGMLTEGVSVNIPQKQQEQYAQFCTMRRTGKPEEVAELVAFLASERASYINAQSIFVDGGI